MTLNKRHILKVKVTVHIYHILVSGLLNLYAMLNQETIYTNVVNNTRVCKEQDPGSKLQCHVIVQM